MRALVVNTDNVQHNMCACAAMCAKQIVHTVSGRKADLNTGAGGQYLYLCVQRSTTAVSNIIEPTSVSSSNCSSGSSAVKSAVIGIAVVFPDR